MVDRSTSSTAVPKIRSSSMMRLARRSCSGTGPRRTTVGIGESFFLLRTLETAVRQGWRGRLGSCPRRRRADQVGTQNSTPVSWPTWLSAPTNATRLRLGAGLRADPSCDVGRGQSGRTRSGWSLEPDLDSPDLAGPAPTECGEYPLFPDKAGNRLVVIAPLCGAWRPAVSGVTSWSADRRRPMTPTPGRINHEPCIRRSRSRTLLSCGGSFWL